MHMDSFKYIYKYKYCCEMCGDSSERHTVLGQRMNRSQGFRPKRLCAITTSVVQCNNYKLIYCNPQPIPEDLQDHYGMSPSQYWKDEYYMWDSSYFSDQIEQALSLLDKTDHIRALDIGAGLGKAMLSMESRGIEAYGLEPSVPFHEKAIERMGVNEDRLIRGAIEDVQYGEEYFDFITYGAVFEHLYEPAACLERSMKWLKKNGIIHIEVPSSDWLISKLFNAYYKLIGTNYVTNLSPMHPPYHLHEFTLKSFSELSKKLNYELAYSRYDVCSIYNIPQVFHGILRRYMKATNTGMQLTVYLRKL